MSETQQPPVVVSVPPTETSPLLSESNVGPNETLVDMNLASKTEAEEPPTLPQIVSHSIEEFRPAVSCVETGVCADVSGSGEHERLERSFTKSRCCAAYEGLFELWHTSAVYVSESLFLLPLHCLLLALPISTGFMGAKYMDKCPMSVPTPLLLFMMGIVGTITVLCRMTIILKKRFSPITNDCEHPKSVVTLGCGIILLFYCTELLCFFRESPSFQYAAKNFCHETFYNFTYYANWTLFGLIVVVILLYLPHFTKMCDCRRRLESVHSS